MYMNIKFRWCKYKKFPSIFLKLSDLFHISDMSLYKGERSITQTANIFHKWFIIKVFKATSPHADFAFWKPETKLAFCWLRIHRGIPTLGEGCVPTFSAFLFTSVQWIYK